jgi:acetoin utilization protein AcuC
MSESVAVIWDDALAGYNFGAGHPFSPLRARLAMQLADELGLLTRDGVELLAPRPATDAELLRVHTADYVDAVKRCSDERAAQEPDAQQHAHGLGTEDNPVFADMHRATSLVVGGAVVAADAVLTGRARHAIHLAGGLHHSMPSHASGFCIYNDLAVGIEHLLAGGIERVAYVDVDVHHGDGVERAFWNDPRVLTVSLHESGATQFPGTGWPDDTGGPDAPYSAVNVALPRNVRDDAWLRAFDAVVPQVLEAFAPQVLVTQLGCDTHGRDPLGHFAVTLEGQAAMYARLHDLAHRVGDGRWIATGGGGYSVEIVPLTWARLIAEATGQALPADTATPDQWRHDVEHLTGRVAPAVIGEPAGSLAAAPWADGCDPDDPVDAAILRTRASVFAGLGLDPSTA